MIGDRNFHTAPPRWHKSRLLWHDDGMPRQPGRAVCMRARLPADRQCLPRQIHWSLIPLSSSLDTTHQGLSATDNLWSQDFPTESECHKDAASLLDRRVLVLPLSIIQLTAAHTLISRFVVGLGSSRVPHSNIRPTLSSRSTVGKMPTERHLPPRAVVNATSTPSAR